MRIAVLSYPGVSRACYRQLIAAAFHLARTPRMKEMSRWSWARFSGWLHALPFEMDTGRNGGVQTATKCTPPQRMREFPATMNCWERVLHQLAWFAARGAERATIYDHDTLVGRHIEVLVPATTNLGDVANAPEDQARDGIQTGCRSEPNKGPPVEPLEIQKDQFGSTAICRAGPLTVLGLQAKERRLRDPHS